MRNKELLKTENGKPISKIGLGTFPFQGEQMADIVVSACECGYALFDTADDYRGETGIGLAINRLSERGIGREQIFIQTKISDNSAHPDEPLASMYFNANSSFMQRHSVDEIVREKVSDSLRKLGTNYLDSLLIHYPYPGYTVDIWKTMIALKGEGKVRYIGVSNFHERHIRELIQATGVAPEINELYLSPIATKESDVNYCQSIGCQVMAYSPLMDLASHRLPSEPFDRIAKKHGKTVSQIILRWNLEHGCMPLPKTKTKSRMAENINVLDFSLDGDEVAEISALNQDYQYCVESRICPGV